MSLNEKLCAGLLALAVTAVTAQAAAPTLNYEINGNNLIITYTGTLYKSSDAVTWTQVTSATSPYKIALGDKKQFFCAKASDEPVDPLVPGKNGTVSLPCGVTLDLNWIKPGTFMMGSPEGELGGGGDEILHQVTLTKGYWLGKYEVTQAQYEAVMGENPSRFKGADLPVENVSWNDAMAFCAKLTEIGKDGGCLPEGYEYTLPTEAQWEYACRAGTTTAFNNGTNIEAEEQIYGECPNLDEIGWYWCNSANKTHPAGQKRPNDWGLYDMHGNVMEWCLDAKNRYPETPVVDPVQEDIEPYYAVRGGSYSYYDDGAKYCRSAARSVRLNTSTSMSLGFRVALVSTLPVDGENITIPLVDDVKLNLIWIKPGTFIMGSPEYELGRGSDETQHQVTLTKGYWLGKYEVTQSQYEALMGENPSKYKGADQPVDSVTWYEAMAFCAKLNALEKAASRLPEGYEYTLPTEAQWEYACRAGTTTALSSGKNLSDRLKCPEVDEVGWYNDNSGGYGGYDSNGNIIGNGKTFPVGQKQPNAWGLYDMYGNVGEWCLDWYEKDYPTTPVTDPKGADEGTRRVCRGGGWSNYAFYCRSADRYYDWPAYSWLTSGFRVALAPVPVSKDVTIPLSDDVELDMIWIEPGTFTMGCSPDAEGVDEHEYYWWGEDQHKVTLTKGYWLGKYEVTQSQYQAIMGNNPSDKPDENGIYRGVGDNHPVYNVSWDDAMEFCAKLTEIEKAAGCLPVGYEYTLPTEAQWEYACRSGTMTALNSGKNLSYTGECPEMNEVGWYTYNSGKYDSHGNLTNNGKTFPVGQKRPNLRGLYDMHGNVYEWCLDWYGDYPTSSVTDPTGPSTGTRRVIRGGSWSEHVIYCRSASRDSISPSVSDYFYGFRVALAPVK